MYLKKHAFFVSCDPNEKHVSVWSISKRQGVRYPGKIRSQGKPMNSWCVSFETEGSSPLSLREAGDKKWLL